VLWNPEESRIEMHLESLVAQRVKIPAYGEVPGFAVDFSAGETIHTENSYKFRFGAVDALLASAGFKAIRSWRDPQCFFAVTLATAV
jgi:uncharacterized SAM-dependent methyltransferase